MKRLELKLLIDYEPLEPAANNPIDSAASIVLTEERIIRAVQAELNVAIGNGVDDNSFALLRAEVTLA
jgi:hypothetical protein